MARKIFSRYPASLLVLVVSFLIDNSFLGLYNDVVGLLFLSPRYPMVASLGIFLLPALGTSGRELLRQIVKTSEAARKNIFSLRPIVLGLRR